MWASAASFTCLGAFRGDFWWRVRVIFGEEWGWFGVLESLICDINKRLRWYLCVSGGFAVFWKEIKRSKSWFWVRIRGCCGWKLDFDFKVGALLMITIVATFLWSRLTFFKRSKSRRQHFYRSQRFFVIKDNFLLSAIVASFLQSGYLTFCALVNFSDIGSACYSINPNPLNTFKNIKTPLLSKPPLKKIKAHPDTPLHPQSHFLNTT